MSAKSASKPTARESAYSINQRRIAGFIRIVQPKKIDAERARRMAHWIVGSAARMGIDPYIVATTAYHESKFLMEDGPQRGIMQFTRGTWNSMYRAKGLRLMDPHDNILGGADLLAMHLRGDDVSLLSRRPLASRGGPPRDASRGAMARMWRRYNGSPAVDAYVRRSFLIFQRIKYGTPKQWASWTRDGRSIWLPEGRPRMRR